MLLVFEAESASAVRNAPTIQHSINHIFDEMELLALDKHAVKDNADVAHALKTARGDLGDSGNFSLGAAGHSFRQRSLGVTTNHQRHVGRFQTG